MEDLKNSKKINFINEREKYQFLITTVPTIIATSILSPLTRLKIILQVMPTISIHEIEKETKPYRLAKSKLI